MKKLMFLPLFFLVLAACKDSVVKTPDKLIGEDRMVEIIYDLSVLDALKSQGYGPSQNYPTPAQLLKKKYNIDSLTFAENSKYYAADIRNYKKMYDKVRERLNDENAKTGAVVPVDPNTQEQGIVK